MSRGKSPVDDAFIPPFAAFKARESLFALVIAVLAAGCGGGGKAQPPTAPPPPPSPTGPGTPAISESGGIPAGLGLVWSDEFDVDGLPDANKWGYDTGRNAAGWYNNELQYYANARAANSRVENGMLVITARKEDLSALGLPDWGNQQYSSARLVTRGLAAWTYGFLEVRAKLPCGTGSWPAIWMLSNPPATAWPDDGEIDIMEHVGFDQGIVHASVHTKSYYHVMKTQKTAQTRLADLCENFHRYQLTWTPERITVGVDDKNFFQFSNDHSGERANWPFDKPQYLLLNIAVGGDWGGMKGIDDKVYPVRMEVDYVRVYQQAAK